MLQIYKAIKINDFKIKEKVWDLFIFVRFQVSCEYFKFYEEIG